MTGGDPVNNEAQFPLWRGLATLIGAVLTALIIWFGSSAAQSREDIAVMREQLSTIRRDLDRVVLAVDRLGDQLPHRTPR